MERLRAELNFRENQSEALKKNTTKLVQQKAYDIIISCLSINKLINWCLLSFPFFPATRSPPTNTPGKKVEMLRAIEFTINLWFIFESCRFEMLIWVFKK